MSWWNYVTRTAGTPSPKELALATGIDAPNFSKWKSGQIPKAETVARFARAYKKPVLEAFVAAGFLTADEAKVRPAPAPDYTQLTNDELLELVRTRMTEGVMGNAEHPAAKTQADSGRRLSAVDESDPDASVDLAALDSIEGVDQPPGEPEG